MDREMRKRIYQKVTENWSKPFKELPVNKVPYRFSQIILCQFVTSVILMIGSATFSFGDADGGNDDEYSIFRR